MKPQRPKAKRTLADFLNRTDSSGTTEVIADDLQIASAAEDKPAPIAKKAKGTSEAGPAKPRRTDLPQSLPVEGLDRLHTGLDVLHTGLDVLPTGVDGLHAEAKAGRKKSKLGIEPKPEMDPVEKLRQREAQIHEAELIHQAELIAKPDASTRRETQARELLQGITRSEEHTSELQSQ